MTEGFIEVKKVVIIRKRLEEGERKVQNVGGRWYRIEGGSFCSHCRIAYNFEKTLEILLSGRKKGMIHGLPRCHYCGKSLRTRSKPSCHSGFWKKLEEMGLMKR